MRDAKCLESSAHDQGVAKPIKGGFASLTNKGGYRQATAPSGKHDSGGPCHNCIDISYPDSCLGNQVLQRQTCHGKSHLIAQPFQLIARTK